MKALLLTLAAVALIGAAHAQVTLDFGPDTSVCEGEVLVLEASSLNADTYLWSTGHTGPSLLVDQSGTYWLVATKDSTTWTDTITITIDTLPVVELGPNDLFFCEGTRVFEAPDWAASYLWVIAGDPGLVLLDTALEVTGQIGQGYFIELQATDANGCLGTGTVFVGCQMGSANQQTEAAVEVTAFPNPATEAITVQLTGGQREALAIQLIDVTGRVVLRTNWPKDQQASGLNIPIAGVPPGSYLLVFEGKSIRHTERLLITE